MKSTPPPTDPRPYVFESHTSAEFFALCDRQRQGEFIIRELERGPDSNAHWLFHVRYAKPYSAQLDLI